jgi:hypothetical protein
VTECYQTSLEFPPVKRRKVEAELAAVTSPAMVYMANSNFKQPLEAEITLDKASSSGGFGYQ